MLPATPEVRFDVGKAPSVPIPDAVVVADAADGWLAAEPDAGPCGAVISTPERASVTTDPSARKADGWSVTRMVSHDAGIAPAAVCSAEPGVTVTGMATFVAIL